MPQTLGHHPVLRPTKGNAVPKVEFTRKTTLTRQQVAERLLAWGNALASGSEVELESGGDSIKLTVADRVEWELEIEIDGDETEIEIELKWRDRPAAPSPAGRPQSAPEEKPAPAGETAAEAPAEEAVPDQPKPPARRGRPRKATS